MIHDNDRKPASDDDVIGIAEDKPEHSKRELDLANEIQGLREKLARAEARSKVPKGLAEAKKLLKPLYDALRLLFEEVDDGTDAGDGPAWDKWRGVFGTGAARRMLDTVIAEKELTKAQLANLSRVSQRSSTFRNGLSKMSTNGLVRVEGQVIRRIER